MTTSILVISDIHGGAPCSLMKERVTIGDPESNQQFTILSNEAQDELRKEWNEMIHTYDHVDKVYCMGDFCDGTNEKGRGYHLITSDMHEQVNIAATMLEDIPSEEYIMVQGSPYHVDLNMSADRAVMMELASRKKIKYRFSGQYTDKVEKLKINLRHKTSYRSNYLNRPNGLISEINNIVANPYYYDTSNRPDIIIRGHTHYSTEVNAHDIHGIISPVWKTIDDFASKTTNSLIPSECGYVYIEVNGNDYDYDIHKFVVDF